MAIKAAIPVLHVSSSKSAQEFYCGTLGFQLVSSMRPDGGEPDPCYMVVTREGAELHLSSFPGDGVSPGVAFVLVDDVDSMHRELKEKSVVIDTGPVDQDWGNREMYVKDADRNSIRFTQPLNS
jgi:uncharacterized glyoxalase superfamily protein PhnB